MKFSQKLTSAKIHKQAKTFKQVVQDSEWRYTEVYICARMRARAHARAFVYTPIYQHYTTKVNQVL